VRVNLIHSTLIFQEKNIVYMTIRVNLIHSKLVFFLKNTKTKHTEKKKEVTRTVQFTCTVHANSASELHCARQERISKNSYELLCKIHVQNVKLHETH
jgi:hypothetical protein